MANVVIVGAQWGDEGKAKVIDVLTKRSDLIIRFQGGANAGHTVIADGAKFVFHMVPSGIMYPGKICIVGNGVVFDAEQFLREVDELTEKGLSTEGRLFVSDQAHLVLPYHKALDTAMENSMGKGKIGTTGRGIGPAYADKVSRSGIRTGDLRNWDAFLARAQECLEIKRAVIREIYKGTIDITIEDIEKIYRPIRERLLPVLTDTPHMIFKAHRDKKALLFEGAQGTFLDIDHGTYPFVTSSNTIAGSVCCGSGVGPSAIDHVVGIVKTYTTRVGNGPFPTEQTNEIGERLRAVGGEFGSTTGRPRRCGWFDSVMLRKAVRVNGLTLLALTKLDVLSGFDTIQICTHYSIDGTITEDFPTDPHQIERAVPIYESMPGWKSDLTGIDSFDKLPVAAKAYIARLKELCYDTPLMMVSVGPDRRETIEIVTP